MAIWRVIYFRHYIIMTQCQLIWMCIQRPYSLLYRRFSHCTQHTYGRSRGSELLEWIAQPSNLHFCTAQGWNKCHDQNVYNPLRVYQVFFFCECFDCQAIFSEANFPIFGIIFIFQAFVFWGSIPYGTIIPLYLNRVVRLTPLHNYNSQNR